MMVLLLLLLFVTPAVSGKLFRSHSLEQQAISDKLISSAAVPSFDMKCPCTDKKYCLPISGPSINPSGEVFGFVGAGTDPKALNWTHITTVAWGSNAEIMCEAHKQGARVVISAPSLNLAILNNDTTRDTWVTNAVALVMHGFYDGIVFDYESPQLKGSIESQTYAKLISDTRDELHAINPSYQVSTCVAWSPDNIDGRDYPMNALSEASDLLYVMDYDTRSQIFDACLASANAPVPGMIHGIQRYLDLGISASKLVLGTPWYGYHYPCNEGTKLGDRYCPIKSVPFRGVNCSDAAGNELDYAKIRNLYWNEKVTFQGRDTNMNAPFFNTYRNGSTTKQVDQYWYDDAEDLRVKYAWAKANGLLGVGPYCLNMLEASNDQNEAVEMWSSLDAFFK